MAEASPEIASLLDKAYLNTQKKQIADDQTQSLLDQQWGKRNAPATTKPSMLERAVSSGGIASPENIGTVGGGAVGATLAAPLGPMGMFLGGALGAGTGAVAGRGYEMLTNPQSAPSGIPNVIGELGSAANRGMMAQAGGEVAGKFLSSGTAALQRKFGKFASQLPNVALARRTAAADEARGLSNLAAPQTPSEPLYKTVAALNPEVNLLPIRDAAAQAARGPTLISDAERPVVEKLMAARGEDPMRPDVGSFKRVWNTMKEINDMIGAAKSGNGEPLGQLLQLKRGMWDALDKSKDAITGPAKQLLQKANQSYRNEYAMEKTADIIANATKNLEGREGEALNIQAARAMDALKKEIRKDPWLEDSFPPDALNRIMSGLDRIRQLPLAGAPTGADAGSKQVLARAIKGGAAGSVLGAGVGYALGSPGVGAAVGGNIGTFASLKAAELISTALSKPNGIKMVERMLTASPQGLTPAQVAVLTTFVRGSGTAVQGISQ